MISITQEKLRAWLESKDEGETVGLRADCYECVHARFLKAQGCAAPNVGSYVYEIDEKGGFKERMLPGWAKRFVRAIDRAHNFQTTAQEALDALNQAAKETP